MELGVEQLLSNVMRTSFDMNRFHSSCDLVSDEGEASELINTAKGYKMHHLLKGESKGKQPTLDRFK